MIGYKIAIGIARNIGPFPVMVELEIPEYATVVKPNRGFATKHFYHLPLKSFLFKTTIYSVIAK